MTRPMGWPAARWSGSPSTRAVMALKAPALVTLATEPEKLEPAMLSKLLVSPGTMYGERSNQVDVRIGKIFRLNRLRTAVNFDLYNALNSNPVLTQNNNFAAWQVPLSVLAARLVKFSVQLDF